MTDREAMKMALDWMNRQGERQFASGGWAAVNEMSDAMRGLRQALAQPEQEHKPWVGLTVDEIMSCGWWDVGFAKAIEAKLKEKNHG